MCIRDSLYYGQSFQLATLPLRIGKNLLILPLEVLMLLFVGRIVLDIDRRSARQIQPRS